jgi:hypothetical protein
MINSKRLALLAMAVVLLMTLSACGDDDSNSDADAETIAAADLEPEEVELSEALLAAAIRDDEEELDAVSPEAREHAIEVARCQFESTVTVLGVETLADAGVTVQALQDGEYEELLDNPSVEAHENEIGAQVWECIDLTGAFRYFGEQDGLEPDVAQCYAEGSVALDGMDELFTEWTSCSEPASLGRVRGNQPPTSSRKWRQCSSPAWIDGCKLPDQPSFAPPG